MDEQVQEASVQEAMETQTDGFDLNAFEAGLIDDALGSQQGAEEQAENADDGLGSQQDDGQKENPGTADNQEQGNEEPGEERPEQPQTVEMTYMGKKIPLPADAVQGLTSALGTDPVELLEKGMNYDQKAARELRLLDRYAQAAGMNRAQYLDGLERQIEIDRLNSEIEKVQSEFPGTPEQAARAIAQQRVEAAKAADRQREAEQQQAMQASRERVSRMVEETRKNAELKAWDAYEQLANIHKAEDVPPRVLELVQKQGMRPTEAHWKYQAEQAESKLKIQKKTEENAGQTIGSMAGAVENAGFEADFLKAFH